MIFIKQLSDFFANIDSFLISHPIVTRYPSYLHTALTVQERKSIMMKTKRFLVKSLATMLAFLFVVSGMTFPSLAASESTEPTGGDLGDKLVAINVAIHGQVSLLFYFKNLDNVSYFKVVAPSRSGVSETKEVPKSSLKYDSTKDRYLLEVSVAAAQQTDTISVQAFDENGNGGKVRSYSVRDYADMVFALAEKSPDKYYYACEALKAMLNYGAMAQKHFAYNTENLANEGLYADGTNPVNGMNASNMYILPDWFSTLNVQGSVGFALASCVLDGKVSLRIYPSYSGDFANLSVRVGYDKENLVSDQLYLDENGWYIAVNGVSAKNFDHLYFVEITDTANNNTVTTGSYSVLNYVQGLYDANPELAASMYMYFVWVSAYVKSAEDPSTATQNLVNPACTHTRTHIDLKGIPGETCSDCGYFFAGFKILGSDTDAACPTKNHNVEAYWTGRDAIHYNVSEYENVSRDGIRFNNTIKSLTLSNFWNSEETDASFNRFSLSYYSSEPVKITLNYTLGGSKKSSDYYLEAGEQTFNAVLPEFLDNGKASFFDSIVVESCKPDAEVAFVLFDYVLETIAVPSSTVSIEGGIHNLSIDLSNGGAITFLSRDDLGDALSFIKNVADTGFAQYEWQTKANTRLIDVQVTNAAVDHPTITNGTYTSVYVKYLIGDTETYFECTYYAVSDGGGMNFIQADNRQIDFSGIDGEFDVHSLPTLHTVTYMSDLYAYDGVNSWSGEAPSLYATSQSLHTHHFRSSSKESWCAWNGAGATIGIFVPNVDSFEAKLVGNTGDLNAQSTTDYGQVSMQKTMKTYAYEAVKYSYIIATGGDVNTVRLNFQASQGLVNNEDLDNDCVPTRIPDDNPDMTNVSFAHEQMGLLLRDASGAVVRYCPSNASAEIDVLGSNPSAYLDFTLYDHLDTYTTYSADDFVQLRLVYMVPEGNDVNCNIYLCSGGTETLVSTTTLAATGVYSTAVIDVSKVNAWTGNIDALKFEFTNTTEGSIFYLRGVQLLSEEKRVTGADFLTEVDAIDLLTPTFADMGFDDAKGAVALTPTNIETFFTVDYTKNGLQLDVSKYNTLKFTCMIPTSNALEMYHCDVYVTVADANGNETTKSIRCSTIMRDGNWHTVVVPLPAELTGTLTSIRLDYLDYGPDDTFANDVFYLYSFILSAKTLGEELASVDFTKRGSAGMIYSAGNNYDIWAGTFDYAYQLYEFLPTSGSSQAGIAFDETTGSLTLTATGTETETFDPYVAFSYIDAGLTAENYSGIRFKYKISEDCSPHQRIQIFTLAGSMAGYAAAASVMEYVTVDGEYHILEIDLSSLSASGYWNEAIKYVRLDFFFTFYSGEQNTMYITSVELIPAN